MTDSDESEREMQQKQVITTSHSQFTVALSGATMTSEQNPLDGAVGMSQRTDMLPADAPDEPERDIESITETFDEGEEGDELKVGIGIALDGELKGGTMYPTVVRVERDVAGFEMRVTMIHDVGDDGWGRRYITGTGAPDLGDWEIVSQPFHAPTGTADLRDMASHGWVVGVEVQE